MSTSQLRIYPFSKTGQNFEFPDRNKYGNLYLIQLHPTVAGDEYSQELLKDIVSEGGF